MFTGIVQATATVKEVKESANFLKLSFIFKEEQVRGLKIGASVAINGVCLTVVDIKENIISFDLIAETLARTNLKYLSASQLVNMERSAKFGDEIGGHILSGHIMTTALITNITAPSEEQRIIHFQASPSIGKYLFSKGYIALNGTSLTLVDVNQNGAFTVHLIPETLRATTFGTAKIGDSVNVEIDSQTQAIVHTVENILANREKLLA